MHRSIAARSHGERGGASPGALLAAALAGAFLGFLFRPSVPLIGQLPFNTVITRGSNLQGIDQLLKSFAEESFNYMVIRAILSAIAMFAYLKMRSPQPAPTPPAPYTPLTVAPEVPAGQTR